MLQHLVEFVNKNVQFDQFKARLRDHRNQISEKVYQARADAEAVRHDLRNFPRKPINQRGELVFDLHPAKNLLREDIKRGRHVGKTPTELRSTRDEYRDFQLNIFKQRIYQEIRYQKFVRYLEQRRATGKHH